jgi:hypothetical protein
VDCTDDGGTNLFSEDFIVQKQQCVNLRSPGHSPLDFITSICVIFNQCFAIRVRCKIANLIFSSIREVYLGDMKGLLQLLWALTQCWLQQIIALQCNFRHEMFYDKSYD